jgi:hypothetical protein
MWTSWLLTSSMAHRYSARTCAAHCMLPQRSPHHSDVVATLPVVAICMALACCWVPSPHVTAAAQQAATATPRIAQPCACERLVRLLGCVCAAAGWLRRPATLPTTTHTLRCTRMAPIPLQDFEVHTLASDFFHGSGTMLAHVPNTACFPQRSLPHTHPHPHPHRLYTYTRTGNIMICTSFFLCSPL